MYNLIIENRKNICKEVKNKEKQKTYNYIKPENYLQIPGWAYEFPLNFSELAVYSIIYGFTQFVEGQWFTGTRRYLAEWLRCSVIKIQRVLNGLVEKGFLEKETWFQNDERHSKYRALPKYKNNNNLFSNEENLEDENFFCASENNLKGGSIKMIRGSIKMKHNITNNKTNYLINKKERKKEDPPQLSFEKINLKNEENIFEQKNKIYEKENSFDALIEKYTQNENLRFELKEQSIMNSWIGFFPLKPYEKIQKRPSSVSQNTSYNIDEYESSMDVFASNDESNPVDEFNPMDEIRKKQKQVDPSFEKFKAEIKDDAIKRFGPRLGNKILKIKEREEFWETVDTLKDMIKRKYYVWFNGDYVCAADIEEKEEEKENLNFFGTSDSPQIEPVFDF